MSRFIGKWCSWRKQVRTFIQSASDPSLSPAFAFKSTLFSACSHATQAAIGMPSSFHAYVYFSINLCDIHFCRVGRHTEIDRQLSDWSKCLSQQEITAESLQRQPLLLLQSATCASSSFSSSSSSSLFHRSSVASRSDVPCFKPQGEVRNRDTSTSLVASEDLQEILLYSSKRQFMMRLKERVVILLIGACCVLCVLFVIQSRISDDVVWEYPRKYK